MPLYVDHARQPYRRMLMSHLLADTSEEIKQAETMLGLPPNSVQYPGTPKEHLDISESKRAFAVRMGAVEVTSKQLVLIIRKKRAQAQQDNDKTESGANIVNTPATHPPSASF